MQSKFNKKLFRQKFINISCFGEIKKEFTTIFL